MSKSAHYLLGKHGEKVALRYLERKGYSLLQKNWRMSNLEVDLILDNGNEIVFVEVKTRSSSKYGRPEESIDSEKQMFLMNAADVYMRNLNVELPARFDVVSIVISEREVQIEHFEDAFYPGEVSINDLI